MQPGPQMPRQMGIAGNEKGQPPGTAEAGDRGCQHRIPLPKHHTGAAARQGRDRGQRIGQTRGVGKEPHRRHTGPAVAMP